MNLYFMKLNFNFNELYSVTSYAISRSLSHAIHLRFECELRSLSAIYVSVY